jgi:CubicO group peptidase (beta-lactamase class C family)
VPVTTYIPELAARTRYRQVTLEHLLRMTSGIDFDEESLAGPRFYYTTNLRGLMYAYDVEWTPGERYLYGSVNIQLLWDVLHRRLQGETVSHYFERQLWQPLGAESPASWSLDSADSGVEKFFGGFNATARDHARLGLLFLHGGTWNGHALLAPAWVDQALSADPIVGLVHTSDGCVRRGKSQWFLTRDGRGYFAKGYHGQYLFVVPDRHWVFVRFGEGYGAVDWPALFVRLADSVLDAHSIEKRSTARRDGASSD